MDGVNRTGFLWWAIFFFVIAIVAGLFGFGFIAGVSETLARVFFVIFVVLFLIAIIRYLARQ
jgi:uncharacterized membrane protein YtjA (UPF0391 family)